MKLKIRKGAVVQVITGSDKGKKGEVLEVDRTNLRIRVQGVRVQTHYDKKEGLLKKEGFLAYSNVKLVSAPAEKAKKKAPAKKAAKAKSAE